MTLGDIADNLKRGDVRPLDGSLRYLMTPPGFLRIKESLKQRRMLTVRNQTRHAQHQRDFRLDIRSWKFCARKVTKP